MEKSRGRSLANRAAARARGRIGASNSSRIADDIGTAVQAVGVPIIGMATGKRLGWPRSKPISNPVPQTMARVVPENPITRSSGTLGRPGTDDVFVTGASDIKGLNAEQIADRLTIPNSPTGFRVIELPTPSKGVASPINRVDPGFVGRGRTLGGAREFVIPNGPIPAGSTIRIVK